MTHESCVHGGSASEIADMADDEGRSPCVDIDSFLSLVAVSAFDSDGWTTFVWSSGEE